jgi:hypothetical protein
MNQEVNNQRLAALEQRVDVLREEADTTLLVEKLNSLTMLAMIERIEYLEDRLLKN